MNASNWPMILGKAAQEDTLVEVLTDMMKAKCQRDLALRLKRLREWRKPVQPGDTEVREDDSPRYPSYTRPSLSHQ